MVVSVEASVGSQLGTGILEAVWLKWLMRGCGHLITCPSSSSHCTIEVLVPLWDGPKAGAWMG